MQTAPSTKIPITEQVWFAGDLINRMKNVDQQVCSNHFYVSADEVEHLKAITTTLQFVADNEVVIKRAVTDARRKRAA